MERSGELRFFCERENFCHVVLAASMNWANIGILPKECSLHRHAQKVFDNSNSIQEIVSRGIDLEHGNADVGTWDF